MKKTTLSLALSLLSFMCLAQTDPIDQYIFKTYFPNLTTYDSITVSADTGSNFSAIATASMQYMWQDNSLIDTCTITDYGTVIETYKGHFSADAYVLAGFDPWLPGDTLYKYVYHKDQQGRDSVIDAYVHDGTQLILNSTLGIAYNSSSQIRKMYTMTDIFMSGSLDTISIMTYHRNAQGRLDSMEQYINLFGVQGVIAKMQYSYQGNMLNKMDVWVDTSSTFGVPKFYLAERFSVKHNSQNEIYEIHILADQAGNGSLSLYEAYRYSIRSNSSIGQTEWNTSSVSLYPNPAHDQLMVESAGEASNYKIISINGQQVAAGSVNSGGINVSHLKAGTYLLQLEVEGQMESLTFTKK